MPSRLNPVVQVLVYPSTAGYYGNAGAVTVRTTDDFPISDEIGDLLSLVSSDSWLAPADVSSPSTGWANQPVKIGSELLPIRINTDNTVSLGGAAAGMTGGVAGLIMKTHVKHYNCYVQGQTVRPKGDTTLTDFAFVAPANSTYATKLNDAYSATSIYNQVAPPDKPVTITSATALPVDTSFEARIDWIGAVEQTTPPAARLLFCGGLYSIVWRQGDPPALETTSGNATTALLTLGSTPSTFSGSTLASVRLVGGYIVVTLDQDAWAYAIQGPAASDGTTTPTDATLPAGKVSFRTYGVKAALALAKLTYSTQRGSLGAQFSVTKQRSGRGVPTLNGLAGVGGWVRRGTATDFTVVSCGQYQANYTCELQADPNGKYTPFVQMVGISFVGGFSTSVTTPVEVLSTLANSPILIDEAHPPYTSGGMASMTIDRKRLAKLDPDGNLCKPFQRIDVKVQQRYGNDDGSITDAALTPLFSGFITDINKSTAKVNDWSMQVQAKDALCLIEAPQSIIDLSYDQLENIIIKGRLSGLYTDQVVSYMIGKSMGEAALAELNGDGNPTRFITQRMQVIGADASVIINPVTPAPLAPGSFHIPMPYLQNVDVLSYTRQILDPRGHVIYVGWCPGAGLDHPVVMFGRQVLINNAFSSFGTFSIPDKVYIEQDRTRAAGSVSSRFLSERSYNEVYVVGAAPDTGAQVLPSTAIGYSRLPASDPFSIENIGVRRTLVITRAELALTPAIAQGIATATMQLLAGIQPREIAITIPEGAEAMHTGMLASMKMINSGDGNISDVGQGLNDVTLRIKTLQHSLNPSSKGADAFVTTLLAGPLTGSGN